MEDHLRSLFEELQNGEIDVEDAVRAVEDLPYKDLEHTKLDTHRAIRRGFPEAIYAEGKTDGEIADILEGFPDGVTALATRASMETFEHVRDRLGEVEYHEDARIIQHGEPLEPTGGTISVVTAGTSDRPVAEECAVSAELMGNDVERIFDVGVSGIHRLFFHREALQESSVVVVVAGMEGALPGIVAGLISVPVIGVPTSVGYGANFGGMAPLLTMLNSCVPGLTVVNIDNGYGAAYSAALINGGTTTGE